MQAARGRRVAPGILVAPPGSKCNRTLRSSFKHPKPRGRKQDRIREKIFLAELTDYPVAKLEVYRIFDNDRYLFCHKSPLAAAPKGANTPKTLKCCNRFTHNAPSIGNLAQGRASVQLQYDNPAKSGFVCVWAPWWNSPPERWRSPRIGRQLLETGRYYGGALHLQLRLLHHYCCSSVFCRCYATTLAQLFTSTTTAAVLWLFLTLDEQRIDFWSPEFNWKALISCINEE